MDINREQHDLLSDRGRKLLSALDAVSTEATAALRSSPPTADPLQDHSTREKIRAILAGNHEALGRLRREPAIARVVIQWTDETSSELHTVYVCRTSAAGIGATISDGTLTSYRASLGRLAEFEPGEYVEVQQPSITREARIVERVALRPQLRDGEWDAFECTFQFGDWFVVLDSLRQALGYLQEPTADTDDYLAQLLAEEDSKEAFRTTQRRQTIDQISLRDQPILDKYQGEIFRLPLNRQLLLLGPPGTGKTTTLIRRLAQKRTTETLTQDELRYLETHGLQQEFVDSDSWVMFSPTELLKRYLRDSFNREGVPATHINLRTWDAERSDLARDVFKILKSGSGGRYIITSSTSIADQTSAGISRLSDEFSAYVAESTIKEVAKAFSWIRQSTNEVISGLLQPVRERLGSRMPEIASVYALAGDSDVIRPILHRLDEQIDNLHNALANHILKSRRQLMDELVDVIAARKDSDDEEIDGDDALLDQEQEYERPVGRATRSDKRQALDLLLRTIDRLALAAVSDRRIPRRGRVAQALLLIEDGLLLAEDLTSLGTRIVFRRHLRILDSAARRLVFDVPRLYNRFRKEKTSESRLYDPSVPIQQSTLSPLEVDILLLVMLRNARVAASRLSEAQWLKPIADRQSMQVFVDEATDFSAVQLACMLELCHPRVRSWFACGDFLQRVTEFGIQSRAELEWIGRSLGVGVEVREVTIGYRQSETLAHLASALADSSPSIGGAGKSHDSLEQPKILPLLAEDLDDARLADWLSRRVFEIEDALGKLPSIAIFVDGDESIDPLVDRVRPLLQERNIPIVGCKAGRDVGETREVRVFDVQHVKGLEFEAVFYVGVDRIASGNPDGFDRQLYVGVTRAATYLGITCETTLPSRMDRVRSLFSTGTWGGE